MAKIILNHDPVLTKEQLKDALTGYFLQYGYEVDYSALIGADLYVKKSSWIGVTIKLKQKPDTTFLRVSGYVPSPALRVLVNGLLPLLILWPKWNKLIAEVRYYFDYEYQTNESAIF
ncbi:hypothetical protein CJD36_001660 [Flavipsychrobacter stenotrophus]|uniref:Uncharacterized protein n=1 Tax=Flavipsychrobacter stenotrophus TaxID=2077091 RepID=A0A2S7T0S1_9BACT|nr:hypothetical protein [Flavipsychrobacter stenotrophus]PQJ12481.1 hypothetical protein CJD36_001660 [Flavipsychrobacter stenotrophus]